jgi:hypothetical protein
VPVSATPKFAPDTRPARAGTSRAGARARLGERRGSSPELRPAAIVRSNSAGSRPGCGGSPARGCATARRRELDDQLGEVGLDRADALALERLVELDLVRGERLDLDDLVGAVARAIAATIAFASAPSRAQWTCRPRA